MNKQIILSSLIARPVRTAVSVLAVALEVTLILVVVGLTNGIATETGKRVEGVGADLMVQAPNGSVILALSGSPMPATIGGAIDDLEGVKAVAPILTMVNTQGGGVEVVYGIDLPSFNSVSGGFSYHEGGPFSAPGEILVDDWYADAKKVHVGDQVELLNHKFKIAGIVENGKGSRVFMSLSEAQDMTSAIGRASLFYVKLDDPDNVDGGVAAIRTILPEHTIYKTREYASLMTSDNLPGMKEFITSVVFLAVCIGVLVIFLSMYTTITERTREIGILRSLGASKSFIVTLILQESFLVCLFGVTVGIGSSLLLQRLIKWQYATLVVSITPDWILYASVFAVISGLIGSLYPSIKAAAQDPVEALAYE